MQVAEGGQEFSLQSTMSSSQNLPVNPGEHKHVNPGPLSKQVAPFLQALASHASYSYWQPIPVKSEGQEQFKPLP